ncbi:MAG: baseplate J/gp47 family protein [Candidatus Micrarchaeia archaeon]
MEEILKFVLERLKTKFPEVDFSPGSALYDLIVVPLCFIYKEFYELYSKKKEEYMLQTYLESEEISEIVDILASNFLQNRSLGNKATGKLYLYFDTNIRTLVYKGATFSTLDGKLYYSIKDYVFVPPDFVIEDRLYRVEIDIEAADFGEEYNVGKNQITRFLSGVSPIPVKVNNPNPITGGLKKETDKEFLERIKREYHFPAVITTKKSLEKYLATYLGLTDVCIIDCNDPEMTRDIYAYLSSAEISLEKNFIGKGNNVILNTNKAYKTRKFSSSFIDKILIESYHGRIEEQNRYRLIDETKEFIDIKTNDFLVLNNNYYRIINVETNAITVSSELPIGDNFYYIIVRFREEIFELPMPDDPLFDEFSIDEYNQIAKSDNFILTITGEPLLSHPKNEQELREKWILSECFYPPNQTSIANMIGMTADGKIRLGRKLSNEERRDINNRTRLPTE